MSRREMLAETATAMAAILTAPMINLGRYRLFAGSRQEYSDRAIRLLGEATVIDMLNQFKREGWPERRQWLYHPESFTEADMQRYRDSGIHVFHLGLGPGERALGRWNGFLANHDQWLMRIDSVADLERVKRSGKVGLLLGCQDSSHFSTTDDIDLYYSLGQRVSQLTYNGRNLIGDGCFERRDAGLSDFGVKVVERMNQVGIAVDVSHCGDRTTLDACEVSKKPVLITHAACRALNPGYPRAKADDAIQATARTGGVMGIAPLTMFVRDRDPVSVEHVLNHFDHVVRLVGMEHLGVGSDYDLDGDDRLPPDVLRGNLKRIDPRYGFRGRFTVNGLDHPKRMFDIAEGLIRRKYSDEAIKLILGGNFKRALSEIWRAPSA